MSNKERSVPPGNGEPVVPSEIFWVKVFKLIPNTYEHWTIEIDQKTSAQSPHGAMQGIVEADIAKKMLENQRAVDEIDHTLAPDPSMVEAQIAAEEYDAED